MTAGNVAPAPLKAWASLAQGPVIGKQPLALPPVPPELPLPHAEVRIASTSAGTATIRNLIVALTPSLLFEIDARLATATDRELQVKGR